MIFIYFICFLFIQTFSLFSGICGSKSVERVHSFATIEDVRREFHYYHSADINQVIEKISSKNLAEQQLVLENLGKFYAFESKSFSDFSRLVDFFSTKSLDKLQALASLKPLYYGKNTADVRSFLEAYCDIAADMREDLLLYASDFFDNQMASDYRAKILKEVSQLTFEKRDLLKPKALVFFSQIQRSYIHGFLRFFSDLSEDDIDWSLSYFKLINLSNASFEEFFKILNAFDGQKNVKLLESIYPLFEVKIDENSKLKALEFLLNKSCDERVNICFLANAVWTGSTENISGYTYFEGIKTLGSFDDDTERKEFFEYAQRFLLAHWKPVNKWAVLRSLKKVPKENRENVYDVMHTVYRDEQNFENFIQLIENIIVHWKDRAEELVKLAHFSFDGLILKRRLEFMIALAQLKHDERAHIKEYSQDDQDLQIQIINRLYEDKKAPHSLISSMSVLLKFSPLEQLMAINTVEKLYADTKYCFHKNSTAYEEYLRLAFIMSLNDFESFKDFLFEAFSGNVRLLNNPDIIKLLYMIEKEKRSDFLTVIRFLDISEEYIFTSNRQSFVRLISMKKPQVFLQRVSVLFLKTMGKYVKLEILDVATKINEELISDYIYRVQSEIDLSAFDTNFSRRIKEILGLKLDVEIPPIVRPDFLYNRGVDAHADKRDEKTKELLEKFLGTQKDIDFEVFFNYFDHFLKELDAMEDGLVKQNIQKTLGIIPAAGFGHLLNANINSCGINNMCPKEFTGRFWYFVNTYAEPNASRVQVLKERENLKTSMMKALSSCVQGEKLICNPGKLQQLTVGVLQGRLGELSVDSASFTFAELNNSEKEDLDAWLLQNIDDITNKRKFKRILNWYVRTVLPKTISASAAFDYVHLRVQQIAYVKRQMVQQFFNSVGEMEKARKTFFKVHVEYEQDHFLKGIIEKEFQGLVL